MAIQVTAAQGIRNISFGDSTTTYTQTITQIDAGKTLVLALSYQDTNGRTISSLVANGTPSTTLTIAYNNNTTVYLMRQAFAWCTLASNCTYITITWNNTMGARIGNWGLLTVTGVSAYDKGSYDDFQAATSFPSGEITPAVADSLILGICQGTTATEYVQPSGAGYTDLQSDVNCSIGYKIVTSTAAVGYTPTAATTEDGQCSITAWSGAEAYDLTGYAYEIEGA